MVINSVFSQDIKYADIREYIICPKNGCGVMSFGGTKFQKEYKHFIEKNTQLLKDLKSLGRLNILDSISVDKKCLELKKIYPTTDFDDEHIIACIILGKIELIVTKEKRACKFIHDKQNKLYASPKLKPYIYKNATHNHLLRKCK